MKTFLLEPTYKKSVVEFQSFIKNEDGLKIIATREEGYRWGSWIVFVPETVEDAIAWCDEMGCSFEDDYGSSLEDVITDATPDVDEDFHEISSYWTEFIEMFDGCWGDWHIIINGENAEFADEDEIRESIEEAFDEDWNEGVLNLGYTEGEYYVEMHVNPKLTPCDDKGNIIDEVVEAVEA
jgi:hypothetical protein